MTFTLVAIALAQSVALAVCLGVPCVAAVAANDRGQWRRSREVRARRLQQIEMVDARRLHLDDHMAVVPVRLRELPVLRGITVRT